MHTFGISAILYEKNSLFYVPYSIPENTYTGPGFNCNSLKDPEYSENPMLFIQFPRKKF